MVAPRSISERPAPTPLGGRLPLRWRLPIVVSTLVGASLLAVLTLTFLVLRWREEEAVRDRVESAARYVADQAATTTALRVSAMRAAAGHPAVRLTLRDIAGGDVDPDAPRVATVTVLSVAAALRADAIAALSAMAPVDTTQPMLLWDRLGRTVLASGPADLDTTGAPTVAAIEAAVRRGTNDAYISPLQPLSGDRTRFWLATPVRDGARTLGYVVVARRVNSPAQASSRLGRLIRDSVTLALRNRDDSHWTLSGRAVVGAPARRDSGAAGITYVRDGTTRYAAESRVGDTPWDVVVEAPAALAMQRPNRTIRLLILVGLVVSLLAGAGAWVAARRLVRPLATLTAAAEGVARGAYDHPVAGAGSDEIARLATSFDTMARRVTAAQHELAQRAEDAQAARADAEHARADAERASRAKSDFLAVMSHELRTPLNAITGYAQLVELGVHGPVNDAQRDALERIGRSGTHLLGLINDVLSFARVDAGQMRYTIGDVELAEVLGEVEALVQPQARAAGVALVREPAGDGATHARADHDKLCQVLVNLLANAVKYTPSGGTVTVALERAGDVVRVHVRDTGVGIAPEKLPLVFEPFVQGDRALNRPHDGVGLGLAIARDLALGMGGAVTATSEPGVGSTFTVTLPANAAASVASAAHARDGLARTTR